MAEPAPQLPQTGAPALATADVISHAEVAARAARKFGQFIDTLDAGVAKRAADAADSLARAGFDPRDQRDGGHLVIPDLESVRLLGSGVEHLAHKARLCLLEARGRLIAQRAADMLLDDP